MKIVVSIFLIFALLIQNVYSQENISECIEFSKRKAKIRYIKIGNNTIREVFINGFRVNDEFIASLSNNKDLYNKVISEIYNRRIRNILFSTIGLPLASVMGYYANKENKIIYTQNGIFQNTTTLGFLLNTLSVFISLYSIVSLIDLLNDITGIYRENLLTNNEVENIINSYNLKLKKNLQENKINFLYYQDNKLILLSVNNRF